MSAVTTKPTDKDAEYVLSRIAGAEQHKANGRTRQERQARLEAGRRLIEVKARFDQRQPEWAALREEYRKAKQMGYQSVEQLAKVGQMLIELKALPEYADDNKAFLSRVIKNAEMQQAHIYRLMNLAEHWPRLIKHKPDSLRAALALIPAKRKPKVQDDDKVTEPGDSDEEETITPKQYADAFQVRALTIREVARAVEHYAQFGTPTQAMIAELRALARLFDALAQKLTP